jgi:uncharacterized protein YjaZ
MSSIKHYIANSTGELSKLNDLILCSLREVIPIVEDELSANSIDIIFISAALLAIPEYGIGGSSPGPNHIYVSFDPDSDKITQKGLNETLLHEIHHCMRWRSPGFSETLGQAMISEGLACLYEQQHSNDAPIYTKVMLNNEQVMRAKKLLNSSQYDHSEWFFGAKKIDKWFGYSYGYKLCKDYSTKIGKTAAELVNVSAQEILNASKNNFLL